MPTTNSSAHNAPWQPCSVSATRVWNSCGGLALLQAVVEGSDEKLHHSLWDLQAQEFLYETHPASEPVYTFKHSLTQKVAYQSLLRPTRQRFHRHIAQVLEDQFSTLAQMQDAA